MSDHSAEDPAAPGGGAEEPAGRGLEGLGERLRSLAEQLRDPELADERAAELAREAADLVSKAGNEVERTLRDAEDDSAAE